MNAEDKHLRHLYAAMASEDAAAAPGFARVARPRPARERAPVWPIWVAGATAAAAIAFFALPSQMAAIEDPTDSWTELTGWTAASDELLTASTVPFEVTSATDSWMETDASPQTNTL